jgi:hypothetical protein
MTVEGVYQEIKDSDKEQKLRQKLLSAHPNLNEFMGNPDSKVLRIRIISFLLLDGLTQSTFREISAEG